MADVYSEIDFLADLPLYQDEKPYYVLPSEKEQIDIHSKDLSNLEYEVHKVKVSDVRDCKSDYTLDTAGFQIVQNASKNLVINDLNDLRGYKEETEAVLREVFPEAIHIHCYDYLRRVNEPVAKSSFDANDPLVVEGPAKGAHNATYDSGPKIIERHLPLEDRERYLKSGYRYRIVNTWRPTLPVLEDRPLAFCDSRTTNPNDLVPVDRVYANNVGEVYYLRHNPKQEWKWFSRQTPQDLFLLLMFDTTANSNARYCPHVSFQNPLAPANAPPRESLETRSIVISKQ